MIRGDTVQNKTLRNPSLFLSSPSLRISWALDPWDHQSLLSWGSLHQETLEVGLFLVLGVYLVAPQVFLKKKRWQIIIKL